MAATKRAVWELATRNYEDFIVQLRSDPVEYISANNLTEDDVLQCISRIVVSGEIEFSHRLQMLIALQESSSSLLTSDERLEVAVSNLINYCDQLKSVTNNFLKGQILTTITIMLLNYENSLTETFASLLSRHCDQLWRILEVVNNKENCLLREIAIECLLEIEESFPCIFLSKLDEICIMCFKENLFPFQNYSSLISCVLKNVASLSADLQTSDISRTNEILVMMKKCPLLDDLNHYTSHSKVNTVITKLLDFVPLLSSSSIHYVVSSVVQLIKKFKLNPLILKTFIHRYMLTTDTTLFDLLLTLKDTFQTSLFSHSEQDALMMLLIYKCSPISLTETNRLVAINYLRQYLDKRNMNLTETKCITEGIFYLPQSLDTLHIKENKLEAYSILLPYFKDKEWHHRKFLESINGIYSQLLRDSQGHYIVALCRILYHSILSQNEPILEAEYQRISLSVVKHHPHFSMHILNLMKKIKLANPNSMFFNYVLSTAVHHVTCSQTVVQHQLHHYLLFLAEAALENSEYSQPKAIVKFLQKILNENILNTPPNFSWLLGHAVLNVCKHILCAHNSNNIYADLGEVLHCIISQNNDIDVIDRAQFYYTLLTTLSPKKITAMFRQDMQKFNNHSTFTSFVPGETAYGIPAPVLHLNRPVLCLTRIFSHEQQSAIRDKDSENVDIDDYLQWLTDSGYSWKASLKCTLSIISQADCNYNDLYGTVVSFVGPSFCVEIPHVCVPCISIGKPHTFSLEVQILESRQTQISASAVFSTTKGQTCSSKLKPLILEFHDLFQPLPVPFGYVTKAEIWRKNLANSLWDKFTSMVVNIGSCGYHYSVMCLMLEEHQYPKLLAQELNAFVTESLQSCSRRSETVGMFLPPRNHLITRIHYSASEGMVVRMAADSRHILAQANIYFCKLEKKYAKLEELQVSQRQ